MPKAAKRRHSGGRKSATVPNAQQLAQRYSLAELLNQCANENMQPILETNVDFCAALAQLRPHWLERISQLVQLGWSTAGHDIAPRLHSCPPTGVNQRSSQRPCCVMRICPYCWARYIAGGLQIRLAALFAVDAEPRLRLDVIEAVNRVIIPRQDDNLTARISRLAKSLGDFHSAVHGQDQGAFSAVTIEPTSDNWLIRKRLLLLVEPEFELPLPASNETAQYQRWYYDSGTEELRRELPKIVGRVAAYPSGLIFGDCVATFEILAASSLGRGRSPRLSRTFGLLRNRSTRARMARIMKT